MPIKIPEGLPTFSTLENENIFVMDDDRARTQDIRPLKIAILNLMPTKVETEIQLLRLLSNTPLQVDVDLIIPSTHESKHTSINYLTRFYKRFSDIEDRYYDGMIITGALLGRDVQDNGLDEGTCLVHHVHLLGINGWIVSSLWHSEKESSQKEIGHLRIQECH